MNKHLQNLLQIIQQDESLTADQKNAALKSLKDADKELEVTAFKLERTEKVKHTTAVLLEETIAELEQKRKAVEAQNRELEIEASLERVRARTMAMQRSDELHEAALLLFQQAKALGASAWGCGFNVWDEDRKAATSWMGSTELGIQKASFKVPTTEYIFKNIFEAAERGESLFVHEISGEAIAPHYQYMYTLPIAGQRLKDFVASGGVLPTIQILHAAFFSKGYLLFITVEPIPELWDVFKRFAKVFEQTYTRFLDLQKAEAQTREAQIELGLERVRARAMAMHNSGELAELVSTLFQELTHLDFFTHQLHHLDAWYRTCYQRAVDCQCRSKQTRSALSGKTIS